jgi:hypothetical protein
MLAIIAKCDIITHGVYGKGKTSVDIFTMVILLVTGC